MFRKLAVLITGIFILPSAFAGYSLLADHGVGFTAPNINGKGNVPTPANGDILLDTGDGTFYGYNGSSWTSFGGASTLVPTGTISAFAGTSAPTGYVLCDGSSLDRTTYAALFAVIGTAYGAVDSTHFNVPDLRGRFLRGVDGAAGNDPDKTSRTAMATGGNTGNNIGSIQADGLKAHSHSQAAANVTGGLYNFPVMGSGNPNTLVTGTTGGNETRPVNAYVNFIIKI